MMIKSVISILVFIAATSIVTAQSIYKTPSGKKYHLNSCRMVENVSKKLLTKNDISKSGLEPCKVCKPPIPTKILFSIDERNKSVGESESVRCIGITQKGTRCKHKTRLANGYCYQHTSQNKNKYNSVKPSSLYKTSSKCGARTKSGGYCERKVKGGGRCYQHK